MKGILLVDDSLEFQQLVTELLELSGYVVRRASTGQQALDHMFEQYAPVVLIDEDLPDLTGAELSYRLKAAARVTWGGKKCVTVAIRGDVTMDQVAGWSSSDYVVLKPLNYTAFDKLIVKCFKEAAETIEGTTDPK